MWYIDDSITDTSQFSANLNKNLAIFKSFDPMIRSSIVKPLRFQRFSSFYIFEDTGLMFTFPAIKNPNYLKYFLNTPKGCPYSQNAFYPKCMRWILYSESIFAKYS